MMLPSVALLYILLFQCGMERAEELVSPGHPPRVVSDPSTAGHCQSMSLISLKRIYLLINYTLVLSSIYSILELVIDWKLSIVCQFHDFITSLGYYHTYMYNHLQAICSVEFLRRNSDLATTGFKNIFGPELLFKGNFR